MSIDPLRQSHRTAEDLDLWGAGMSPKPVALTARREAADLDYPIEYSPELFRLAGAPTRTPNTIERSKPRALVLPGGTLAPKKEPEFPKGPVRTDNPKEITTVGTPPDLADVITVIRNKWPQLSDQGARTLAAQFVAETGGGKNCFNWNVGNMKAGPHEPHTYLAGTWEVETPENAAATVAAGKGLARVATEAEIKEKGWACPPGKAIVVYSPPHAETRFCAFRSLDEGVAEWLKRRHQPLAAKDPTYLDAMNRGDVSAVASALKKDGYYSTGTEHYTAAMKAAKVEVDKVPVSP